MSATVRAATPEDVPTLIELMRALAAFEDYLDDFRVNEQVLLNRAFGPSAQCQVFVAQWLSQIAGYATGSSLGTSQRRRSPEVGCNGR